MQIKYEREIKKSLHGGGVGEGRHYETRRGCVQVGRRKGEKSVREKGRRRKGRVEKNG